MILSIIKGVHIAALILATQPLADLVYRSS